MPSESVWFEQVDIALVDYISAVVKLPNNKGVLTSVPVTIRKPDEDFKVEVYPCITLYNLYSNRNDLRYNPERQVVKRDSFNPTLVVEDSAIPYDLTYQIDFWAKKQSEMNEMTRLWLSHNPDKYINLPVKDVSGNQRNSFMLQTEGIKKSDFISGDKRLFHSFLTYRIWVELDERVDITTPMITTVINRVDVLTGKD